MKLRYRQAEVDFYVNLHPGKWPRTLQNTMRNVSDKIGWCLDIQASTIRAWLGTRREMSYEEVSKFMKTDWG